MSRFRIEKRMEPGRGLRALVTLLAVILALLLGGVVIFAIGVNPVEAYAALFRGAFGSLYGLSETVVKMTPLIFCALSVALCLRMKLWNIGAEGQYVIGALFTALTALKFPGLPVWFLLPLMALAGFLAAAIWGGIAGLLKASLNVNEIITTLLMNWIAILLAGYFVYGPLRGADGFPFSKMFSSTACLPAIGWGRVHTGIFLAGLAAIVLYLVLEKTIWGFEVKVIGDNREAARFAGMKIGKNIFLVLFLAGGLAGLGGFVEISGIEHRLPRMVALNYGYDAILIAWLARSNPLLVLLVAFLFGGLMTGGEMIQIVMDVPISVIKIMEGAILFFLLAGETLMKYRVKIR